MVSFFATLPGAVLVDDQLLHFGNPFAEQRALFDPDAPTVAIAVLPDRLVIEVSGSDRLSWLDSMCSQSLKSLPPGVSTEALFLDPHGHIDFAVGVVDNGSSVFLFCDRQQAADLAKFLTRMRFRMDVSVSELTGVVVGSRFAVLNDLVPDALIWRDPWPELSAGGFSYTNVSEHPGSERDWAEALLSEGQLMTLLVQGGFTLAGPLAAAALRVAAWRPSASAEGGEKSLPHEFDWLRTAVHLNKGCYRGQETVAKIHNLGHPPRRLVFVHLDGSINVLPEPGDEILLGEQPVGRLTSVTNHFELGPVALALVKRNLAADSELFVSHNGQLIGVQLEEIVAPSAGSEANVPRIPRLNRRARGQR